MNITEATTKELVDELSKRGGVFKTDIPPNWKAYLMIDDEYCSSVGKEREYWGPSRILVVVD